MKGFSLQSRLSASPVPLLCGLGPVVLGLVVRAGWQLHIDALKTVLLALHGADTLAASQRAVSHTYAVQAQIYVVETRLVDAEDMLRGYLLTGDTTYLAPYSADRSALASEIAQLRVPVSSLCIAAAVPATTALRWLKTMTQQGLFVRRADPHDGRRVFVELAPGASRAMRAYFAEVGQVAAI